MEWNIPKDLKSEWPVGKKCWLGHWKKNFGGFFGVFVCCCMGESFQD